MLMRRLATTLMMNYFGGACQANFHVEPATPQRMKGSAGAFRANFLKGGATPMKMKAFDVTITLTARSRLW